MNNELLIEFIYDSRDHLNTAGVQLLDLEKEPGSLTSLNALMGTLHTIKGNSGFLGLQNLFDLLHHAESLLQTIRDKQCSCPPEMIDLMLQVLDTLEALFNRLENGEDDLVDWQEVLKQALSEAEVDLEAGAKDETSPAENPVENPPKNSETGSQASSNVLLTPDYVIKEDLSGKINLVSLQDGQLAEKDFFFPAQVQAMFEAGLEGLVVDLKALTSISGPELRILTAANGKNPDKTAFILDKESQESLYRIFQILHMDKSLNLFSDKEQAVAYIRKA